MQVTDFLTVVSQEYEAKKQALKNEADEVTAHNQLFGSQAIAFICQHLAEKEGIDTSASDWSAKALTHQKTKASSCSLFFRYEGESAVCYIEARITHEEGKFNCVSWWIGSQLRDSFKEALAVAWGKYGALVTPSKADKRVYEAIATDDHIPFDDIPAKSGLCSEIVGAALERLSKSGRVTASEYHGLRIYAAVEAPVELLLHQFPRALQAHKQFKLRLTSKVKKALSKAGFHKAGWVGNSKGTRDWLMGFECHHRPDNTCYVTYSGVEKPGSKEYTTQLEQYFKALEAAGFSVSVVAEDAAILVM